METNKIEKLQRILKGLTDGKNKIEKDYSFKEEFTQREIENLCRCNVGSIGISPSRHIIYLPYNEIIGGSIKPDRIDTRICKLYGEITHNPRYFYKKENVLKMIDCGIESVRQKLFREEQNLITEKKIIEKKLQMIKGSE